LEKNYHQYQTQLKALQNEIQQKGLAVDSNQNNQFNLTENYRHALDLYHQKDYQQAISIFSEIVQHAPFDANTDNVLFQLGESYLQIGNKTEALISFQRLYGCFPFSDKSPETLFKIGNIYESQGQNGNAYSTFMRLINEYSGSLYEKKATEKLTKIKNSSRRK
jgi:TolA-binding protein